MENKNVETGKEGARFPTDSELIESYKEIESRAIEAIQEGRVVGNPTLRKGYFGPQWSIAFEASLEGIPLGLALRDVVNQLRIVEPQVSSVPLHVTLGEVAYWDGEEEARGRKAADMRSRDVLARYHAVKNNLPDFAPIRLKLWRIIPTLDLQKSGDGRAMAIVAAFVTDDDPIIWRVRAALGPAVAKAGLSAVSRAPRVIFATLGRLRQAPARDGNQVPLLEMLEVINRDLYPSTVDIDRIPMVSTVNYRTPPWVYVDPPIALKKSERLNTGPFYRPARRYD